ncbi:MAG: hypothetical protein JWR54_2079, partial [Mucilaginibacter sp.]|nr:hypothetical protein [Mucilaginibacter sp.]
ISIWPVALNVKGICATGYYFAVYCYTHSLLFYVWLDTKLQVPRRAILVDIWSNSSRSYCYNLANSKLSKYKSGFSKSGEEFEK